MNKVTVQKTKLREAVAANRANHRELFLEAIEGYRLAAVALFERHIARLRANKQLREQTYLPVPADHTRDYDRILRMIDLHAAELIDISQEDFAKYVMDDWQWRREFLGTSANYSAKAKAALDDADDA